MLSGGDQFDSLVGIRNEVVQPAMGVTQGFDEDRTRPNLHRADQRAQLTFALDDFAALVRRWRYSGNSQCSTEAVDGNGLAEPDLDLLRANRDSLDRVEHVLMTG